MFSIDNNVFGYSQYKKLNIGDLVSWFEIDSYNNIAIPDKIKKFGIISGLSIAYRGDRKVAIVRVIPLNQEQREKEVLAISIEIVNKTKESLVL